MTGGLYKSMQTYTALKSHMHTGIYVTSMALACKILSSAFLEHDRYMNIHIYTKCTYTNIYTIVTYHMLSTKSILHIFATFQGRIIHHPSVISQRLRHSKAPPSPRRTSSACCEWRLRRILVGLKSPPRRMPGDVRMHESWWTNKGWH